MKKILLTLAAIGLAASAWAENATVPDGFIDVTPKYFKFYQHEEIPLDDVIRTDVQLGQANLGKDNNITTNTSADNSNPDAIFNAKKLNDGNMLIGGAYYGTEDSRKNLRNGFSTYDFGGEIGNVLILNGFQSTLDEAIQTALGVKKPEIPKMAAKFSGNLQLFWILDYISMNSKIPQGCKVRVRLELNGYYNGADPTKHVTSAAILQDEENNPWGAGGAVTFSEFTTDEGKWNPYRWMVYEFDVQYNRLASYIKQTVTDASADINNGALLIRSIEIYGIPDNYSDNHAVNTVYKSWNEYTPAAKEEVKVTLDKETLNLFAGTSAVELKATVEGTENDEIIWSTDPEETDVITLMQGYIIPNKPGTVKVIATAAADETAKAECVVTVSYDEAGEIILTHPHDGAFELSAGEEATLTLDVIGKNGCDPDPDALYTIVTEQNENGHVTFETTQVKAGEIIVKVAEEAGKSENPVLITVTAGDVTSDAIELNHYAAPAGVELVGVEGTTIQLPNAATEYKVKVASKLTDGEGAYQKFSLEATDASVASVELNAASDGILVTPIKTGTSTFIVFPYLAGEYKTNAKPASEPTEFTVNVGTTGIEIIGDNGENVAINAQSGAIAVNAPAGAPVAVFTVNGSQVAGANGTCRIPVTPGYYVVTVGKVAFKVIVK